MKFADIYRLANANLWRTKLRTILTTLGVVVGIGALVSMVAFGVGMQKNVTDEIKRNDLFTTLEVTPGNLDLERVMSGDVASVMEPRDEDAPVLDDAAVEAISALPGVQVAFPEVRFPVTVRFGDREAQTNLQALPAAMGRYKPFDELPDGRFFESDDERSVVLSRNVLRDMGLDLDDADDSSRARGSHDDLPELAIVSADSILGREITIVSSVLDERRLLNAAMTGEMPLRQVETRLTVVGIRGRPSGFGIGHFAAGIVGPSGTVAEIPRLGFTSVWQLLRSDGETAEYPTVHVRAASMDDLETARAEIESLGFSVLALVDQLEEFKQQFLVLDALLGAVGTIALFVASLGIVNTMVTSILERTREIGVMKAIGGSEGDIKWIFFVEAGTIGLAGGVFGLLLGWGVTRVANMVVNYHLRPSGLPPADLFHMPPWLLLGALVFSVLVSLLAGVYPAARAARVDPVAALRHD
ncbi:MAG: ABC transporter permease [Candidatus Eisenbacteria bacterium]